MPALNIAISILSALVKFAPQIPGIVEAVETTITLLRSGEDPTPAQQAQIDAALDAAHAAVQAA